jgi:RimJ/RimL family protein N-acetyltransferase
MDPTSVMLLGKFVRLEPLTLEHAPALLEAGRDLEIWRYMPRVMPTELEEVRGMIREANAAEKAGSQLAFAIVDASSGRAVGSTRYLDIRREHKGLEIGWTWIGTAHQRSAVNTECKLLLMRHAFETLGAMRVQLKTDHLNVRSQRAIERLGAVREGVLRSHMVRPDGTVRDTVMYGITTAEWPTVKARLTEFLSRPPAR